MYRDPTQPLQSLPRSRALVVTFLALILMPALAAADTNIGGGAVSGLWTLAGSPYHVLGDINIPEGDTLRIEPGVTIDFANNPQLAVYGVLEAVGTEADSIRFNGPGEWRGVAFHNPDASHMTYCVLEAPGFQQIGISGSCPQFAHCALRNSGKGVNMWGTTGTVTFANCRITDCTVGMEVNYDASVTMTACHIGANDEGGIKVFASCTLTMIDCRIVGNQDPGGDAGGITLEQGTLVMEGCELSANWVPPGYTSTGSALNVLNGSSATLDRCTIAGNEGRDAAVFVRGSSASATMTNSIVTHNAPVGIIKDLGSLSVRYCDFYDNWFAHVMGAPGGFGDLVDTNPNGDPCDIYGNIFFDPLYVDQPGGDLHLMAGSPCIDAGDPAHPADPDGTPVDMGAYYFHQTSGAGEWPQPARDFALEVYPNPATLRASIGFIAPRAGRFRIDVFDLSGRRVAALANRDLTAGPQTVVWRGCDSRGRALPTGMYLLRLATDTDVVTRRVTLLR